MAATSGPYTWVFNGNTLGVANDAPRYRLIHHVEPVVGDNLGDTIQDGVYRGHDCYIDIILNEFDLLGARQAFWPWASEFGEIDNVGCRMLTYAKRLEATAIDVTCTTPTYMRFDKAILAPGYEMALLYGSRLRNVPLSLLCLPFLEGGKWYVFRTVAVS